jgi:hypothetical protein
MAIAFEAIEQAIIAWLAPTFGAGRVILAREKGTQPDLPYAAITITGPRPVGAPRGSFVQSYDPAQPGQEIELKLCFEQELTASVQAFAASTRGSASAMALLTTARNRSCLPSQLTALNTVGLSVLDRSDVKDLSRLVEASFQGRALLELTLLTGDDVAERTGYVAVIGVSGGLMLDGMSVIAVGFGVDAVDDPAPIILSTVPGSAPNTLTVHGTGAPGSTVEFYRDGLLVATTPVAPDGTWTAADVPKG